MNFITRLNRILAVSILISLASHLPAAVGDTRVAPWKDDRTGVFLLMFDDGWPGQIDVGVPELKKRNLTATFYMVPLKGEYKVRASKWAEAAQSGNVVYGNHTMTHGGVRDYEHAKTEIGECTRIIREELQPIPGKPNRLISYARPGVGEGKWTLSAEDEARILRETNSISRGPFGGHGAVFNWKTLEQMTALGDKAIAGKDMNYLIIHGVERLGTGGQDFWALKQDIFFPLLDYLKAKQDSRELWVTDHISWHQYFTERSTATVKTLKVIANGIQLELKSQADPKLYDLPLYGIGSDSTRQVIWRLENGELDNLNPKLVVLMIGTNNIYDDHNSGTDAEITEGVAKIVGLIHAKAPSAKVLLLGVLPRQNAFFTNRTTALNKALSAYAAQNKIQFIDASSKFLNAEGAVAPALFKPDLVHLSAEGYTILADAIQPTVTALLKP